MGENSGLNTAEKSISGVEKIDLKKLPRTQRRKTKMQNTEEKNKTHGGWEEKAESTSYWICRYVRKVGTETLFGKIMAENIKLDDKKKRLDTSQ